MRPNLQQTAQLLLGTHKINQINCMCNCQLSCEVQYILTGDWQVTGGVLKIVRRICEVGMPGWPVTRRRRGGHSQ